MESLYSEGVRLDLSKLFKDTQYPATKLFNKEKFTSLGKFQRSFIFFSFSVNSCAEFGYDISTLFLVKITYLSPKLNNLRSHLEIN